MVICAGVALPSTDLPASMSSSAHAHGIHSEGSVIQPYCCKEVYFQLYSKERVETRIKVSALLALSVFELAYSPNE
jgi:hypothetical protein